VGANQEGKRRKRKNRKNTGRGRRPKNFKQRQIEQARAGGAERVDLVLPGDLPGAEGGSKKGKGKERKKKGRKITNGQNSRSSGSRMRALEQRLATSRAVFWRALPQ